MGFDKQLFELVVCIDSLLEDGFADDRVLHPNVLLLLERVLVVAKLERDTVRPPSMESSSAVGGAEPMSSSRRASARTKPDGSVFVSYDRRDKERVGRIVDKLRRENLPVRWDVDFHAGDKLRPTVKTAIERASAVVVLWSKFSVESHWVVDEATAADRLDTLVPALLDRVDIPMGFGQRLTSKLFLGNDEWRTFIASIMRKVRQAPKPDPGRPGRREGTGASSKRNRESHQTGPRRKSLLVVGVKGSLLQSVVNYLKLELRAGMPMVLEVGLSVEAIEKKLVVAEASSFAIYLLLRRTRDAGSSEERPIRGNGDDESSAAGQSHENLKHVISRLSPQFDRQRALLLIDRGTPIPPYLDGYNKVVLTSNFEEAKTPLRNALDRVGLVPRNTVIPPAPKKVPSKRR